MIKSLRKLWPRESKCRSATAGKAKLGQPHAQTAPFFDCLLRLGFNPRHIVDVGAHRGGWTRTAMKYFPQAEYSLFEPQADLLAGSDLEEMPKVSIFPWGVGPSAGIMKLSMHDRRDSFSFALSEQQAISEGRKQIDCQVVALDAFLEDSGRRLPDVLKIDAEGWDLEVLKGARKCVAHSEVVLLEAAVMNKFFSNSLERVIAAMSAHGFVLFDITDLNRTKRHRALWLVEAAFVKEGGMLDRAVATYA
jgi:FkbM family methyltransferase